MARTNPIQTSSPIPKRREVSVGTADFATVSIILLNLLMKFSDLERRDKFIKMGTRYSIHLDI